MPKKEHWSKRLRRENSELKVENAALKHENDGLKHTIKGASAYRPPAGYTTIKDTGKDVEFERIHSENDRDVRTKVFVFRRNRDENFIIPFEYFAIEGSSRAYQIKEHEGDEIDLFVMDDSDRRNCVLSGGSEMQGSWANMLKDIKKYWIDGEIQDVPIRTIFDPHGFFDELPEVQAQEVIRGKLSLIGEDQVVDPPPPIPNVDGYWQIGFPELDQVIVNGTDFLHAWQTADSDLDRANLMKDTRDSIQVRYVNGREHDNPVYHFSIVGEIGDPMQDIAVSIAADPDQEAVVSIGDKTPKAKWIGNYMEHEGDGIYGSRSSVARKVRFE